MSPDEMVLKDGTFLKLIPSSPNSDYMAGSDGNIYSRTHYKGFGRKVYVDWYPLKGHPTGKSGYISVSLCHENVKVTRSVHTLVCEAFHGPKPQPHLQVRHLDGIKENTKPGNLIWGTQIENWQDRKAHGHGCSGERHHAAKFSNEERKALRWAVQRGLASQRHAARILGVTQSAIFEIVHGDEE